ncbi:hypothetical protein OG21DRAFT_1397585, partial [Imleria badia]
KCALIAFHYIPGSHTGNALARALLYHLIGHGRDAVHTLRNSGQRWYNFQQTIKSGNEQEWCVNQGGQLITLPVVELLHDVKTRWDSTYYMINLCACNFQVPCIAQKIMYGEKTPLLGSAVPAYELFMKQWRWLSDSPDSPQLQLFISTGLEWADYYYNRLGRSKAYLFAMFVDPCICTSWVQRYWETEMIMTAKTDILQKVKYHAKHPIEMGTLNQPVHLEQPHTFATLSARYGLANMDIRPDSEEQVTQLIDQEYNSYVTSSLSHSHTDPLVFWELEREHYPTIFRMAMDFLPI